MADDPAWRSSLGDLWLVAETATDGQPGGSAARRGYRARVATDERPRKRTPGQIISLALLVVGLVAMLIVIVIVSRALS